METIYGKYPKRIICQCNAEEMNVEEITIELNERCPICNKQRQVCVPKPEVKTKLLEVNGTHGEQDAA